MHEVHGPDLVRTCGLLAVLAELRLHAPLRVFVPELQAQLIVNPAGLLHVDLPAFPAQQHMHTAVAIAHSCFGNLLDPSFDGRLVGAPGLVVERGGIKPKGPTSPPDRYAPIDAHPANQLAHPSRLQSFRRMTCLATSRGPASGRPRSSSADCSRPRAPSAGASRP